MKRNQPEPDELAGRTCVSPSPVVPIRQCSLLALVQADGHIVQRMDGLKPTVATEPSGSD